MNRVIFALIMLAFPITSLAETYVCSSTNSDDLYTYKRDGERFTREGFGATFYFQINDENDTWIFLSDAQMGRTDYFQFMVVAINKVTMEYQSGVLVAKDWAIYPSEMTGGRCTEV